MRIEMTCPTCGTAHIPTRSDLMKPRSVYLLCPRHRPAVDLSPIPPNLTRSEETP